MSELGLAARAAPLLREFAATEWLASWQPAVEWLAAANTLATRRSYASALRLLAATARVGLGQVESRHVLAFKAAMVSRRLAPRTVRQRLAILNSFFGWCIAAGHHPGPNPAAGLPLPRVGRVPVGLALDGEQVEELLAAAATARDRALLALLASGGLRAMELCGLQERDVLLEKHGGELVGVRVYVRHGKGGRSRTIDLNYAGAAPLAAYLAAGPRVSAPSRPLFQWLDGSGRGIGYWTVYGVVRQAAVVAGLGHVAPHDLRRTQITMALDAGEPAPRVQRRAGHSSLEQTVRYYREGNG